MKSAENSLQKICVSLSIGQKKDLKIRKTLRSQPKNCVPNFQFLIATGKLRKKPQSLAQWSCAAFVKCVSVCRRAYTASRLLSHSIAFVIAHLLCTSAVPFYPSCYPGSRVVMAAMPEARRVTKTVGDATVSDLLSNCGSIGGSECCVAR